MSSRRQVWETLAQLLERVESGLLTFENAPATGDEQAEQKKPLAKEVHKLGKEQYKANLLAERQAEIIEQALDQLRNSQKEDTKPLETYLKERENKARKELLEAVLPALDSVENAIKSGNKYLAIRDKFAASSPGDEPYATIVSPADRAMLAGWLDGLRLVHDRLLGILKAGEVYPIPTIGHSFDPYLHVAVERTSRSEKEVSPGTILAEEQRGYRSESGVLRYAEVIVYQP